MTFEIIKHSLSYKTDHEWLSSEFIAESQRQALADIGRKHHYIPQMYLRRWAVNGLVQPVVVDASATFGPQPPKEVAQSKNFYTLPQDGTLLDMPLRWIEKHLSRIESECSAYLDKLETRGPGEVYDAKLKKDFSVYLDLQLTRTPANRERTLRMIQSPPSAKRAVIDLMGISVDEYRKAETNSNRSPKQRALKLMLDTVKRVVAGALCARHWAVYSTATPIVTCDDPVVLVAGPPFPRELTVGVVGSGAILYPIGPHHILVMLREDLTHTPVFELDRVETQSINLELVAAATRSTFERPGDEIAVNIAVPPRPLHAPP